MLLYPASDFHFDFHQDWGESFLNSLEVSSSVDVLVMAGDLAQARSLPESIRSVCDRFKDVVFVAGNHDFWHSNPKKVFDQLAQLDAEISNFHWLENRTLELHGRRFVGCTLWFEERPESVLVQNRMMDFKFIDKFKPWVYSQNRKSLKFLRNNVRDGDIVVTHHLPSQQSVAPAYKGSDINCFFVCDAAEKILTDTQPAFWIHGHSHTMQDYMAGETRVICNPFGYPRQYTGFQESFILDLP